MCVTWSLVTLVRLPFTHHVCVPSHHCSPITLLSPHPVSPITLLTLVHPSPFPFTHVHPSHPGRYLIFFDDGYAQYVHHSDIRVVTESSACSWEDVSTDSREFIKEYLQMYPERPMVRLQKWNYVKTEWNGECVEAGVKKCVEAGVNECVETGVNKCVDT